MFQSHNGRRKEYMTFLNMWHYTAAISTQHRITKKMDRHKRKQLAEIPWFFQINKDDIRCQGKL
jgi:hypothetical protein